MPFREAHRSSRTVFRKYSPDISDKEIPNDVLPFNGGYSVDSIEDVIANRAGVLVLPLNQLVEVQRPRVREVRLRILRYLHFQMGHVPSSRKHGNWLFADDNSATFPTVGDRATSFLRINARSRERTARNKLPSCMVRVSIVSETYVYAWRTARFGRRS